MIVSVSRRWVFICESIFSWPRKQWAFFSLAAALKFRWSVCELSFASIQSYQTSILCIGTVDYATTAWIFVKVGFNLWNLFLVAAPYLFSLFDGPLVDKNFT